MRKPLSRPARIGFGAVLAAMALAGIVRGYGPAGDGTKAQGDDAALKRARREVKMLDELYKNAVVSITQIYGDGPPAVRVAKQVFKAMEDGEYHSAKLVDATGSPLNEANRPATPFEERAEKAILEGKAYYEEVVGEGADRRLLAATVVPAVLPRCAKCHGVEEGELLGFIRYDLKVE
jgi:hypothetical protein